MSVGWSFFKDGKGFWRWTRRAKNGRVIAASSEGFVNFEDAQQNARFSGFTGVVAENAIDQTGAYPIEGSDGS